MDVIEQIKNGELDSKLSLLIKVAKARQEQLARYESMDIIETLSGLLAEGEKPIVRVKPDAEIRPKYIRGVELRITGRQGESFTTELVNEFEVPANSRFSRGIRLDQKHIHMVEVI